MTRRIFKIDIGNMPPQKVVAKLKKIMKKVKNDK